MNIKDFKYFNALVENKNFSIVAQQFNVSQPTITMAIKRLEEEFDAKLFIRNQSHKELIVTEAGHQLYAHTTNILKEITIAKKELQIAKQHKIIFGLPPIIGTYYFPMATPELLRQGLLNKLTIISKGSIICRKMLLAGDLDIALLGSIEPITQPGLITEVFAKSPLKIIVGPGHPWYHRKKITLSELKGQKFITQNESYIHNQALQQVAKLGHFHPEIVVKTDNINILKALVSENIGIGLLTEIAIKETDQQLHALDVDAEDFPAFIMSIAYRAQYILTKQQQQLLEILHTSI